MREIHAEDDTVGSPRMTFELANRGRVVNHKRVERLMRAHGIVGIPAKRRVRTTIPAEASPPLPEAPQDLTVEWGSSSLFGASRRPT